MTKPGWGSAWVSAVMLIVPVSVAATVKTVHAQKGSQPNAAAAPIVTSQYDNARTGTTLNERVLTPANVNARQFGKVGAYKVDGAVYAQPLYVPGVPVPDKGTRNVLYVATEHDSVYAFDADAPGSQPLWQVNFLDAKPGLSTVPARDANCPFIAPEVGITSTPVIDIKTGTIFVLARTMLGHTVARNEYFQNLHALAITTGAEKFGGPKLITATAQGKGDGASNGLVAFNDLRENPRAAMLLTNGVLYLTWASSCDVDPYHGWVMAYDPQTLEQKAQLNVTPDGSEGGIWMSDAGPAADSGGNIYVPVGNGTFDANKPGGRDYGDSILKLGLEGSTLAIRDSFTPFDQEQLSKTDADLGSSGPTVLPEQPGSPARLLVQPAKSGAVYLINRDSMGAYGSGRDRILQKFMLAGGCYGAAAYWNQRVYIACEGDQLRSYSIENGQLRPASESSLKFDNPGATPSVSANGTKDAIVWAVATKTWNGPQKAAVLYAFDAVKLGAPIYTSLQNSQRDDAGLATRFVLPIVANGRVYFAARGEVDVYGLIEGN
jgi:hypothetical protein